MTSIKTFLPLAVSVALAAGACLDSGAGTAAGTPAPDATPHTDPLSNDAAGADALSVTDKGAGPDVPQQPDTATTPDTSTSPDTSLPPDVPTAGCFGSSTECYSSGECCSGICTYDGNSYVPGQCVDPLPDGSYCEANSWCKAGACEDYVCGGTACTVEGAACFGAADCCSGSCQGGVCVTPTCGAAQAECWSMSDCCSGLCTQAGLGAYVPGVCVEPQPDGYACESAAWCQSGVCTGGVCGGGSQCQGVGAECWGGPCCEGTFCTYAGDYQPGACTPTQPDGAYCYQDSWCGSGKCVDNQCVSAECKAVESACFSADDCCTGLCTYDGGESAGACVELCELGDACLADAFCSSGNCQDGTCAAPKVTFSDVWELVIAPNNCSSGYCHGSGSTQGLSFADAQVGFWTLTQNMASIPACDAYAYVVPYAPEQSILWLRTRPASQDVGDPCVAKMPKGSEGLDADSAELIRQWILAGAPQ